jgi:hypothetical protein
MSLNFSSLYNPLYCYRAFFAAAGEANLTMVTFSLEEKPKEALPESTFPRLLSTTYSACFLRSRKLELVFAEKEEGSGI